ncbi:putative ribosome biogenesis GTPase RsgA [Planctomycetales bacterium]|nr:putative ribosome biogenesis GTPase RsgA [Planctomycetales bacterium]
MPDKEKIRIDFRKNRSPRTRITDWTKQYEQHGFEEETTNSEERLVGKGENARKRTVIGEKITGTTERSSFNVLTAVEADKVLAGRVMQVHGASCEVLAEDGRTFRCVVRRILKTVSLNSHQSVVAGDKVLFREANNSEGMIERVEPRYGSLSREVNRKKHIIITNVDRVFIIVSALQPELKPNLIDRMLVSAEQSGIEPVICINKCDLVSVAELQPLIGVYARMEYKVLLASAKSGQGIEQMRRLMTGRESVVLGQSGVGKSSLLNAADKSQHLRIGDVGVYQKGKHTTTTAELLPLSFGGYIADTPGMRQFLIWDVIPEEVFGLFRDLRPYENHCRFPDCTHSHEAECAVKNAVAEGHLDFRRYESYLNIRYSQNDGLEY